ncbi:MAG: cobaltochelatase subunit CobN [Acidimicrobiales bacterium]
MILFLTNADTELLALRQVLEDLPDGFPPVRAANPHRLGGPVDLDGVAAVLVRLLGGRRAWEEPFDELAARCAAAGVPLLAFGGEAVPDAELAAASTVPSATVVQAFGYLAQGGPANLAQLLRFLADTVLVAGFGFEPPREVPDHGVLEPVAARYPRRPGRPLVGVVFYRAHLVAGNTRFVEELCAALDAAGADPLPVHCYSLRAGAGGAGPAVVELLARHGVDAVVTTVLAAGGARGGADADRGGADADRGTDATGWDPGALATLDVPVVQAVCATTSSAEWASGAGLSPVDVAMAVAIPEFDGRIVSVPFSFKEEVDDGDELGAPLTAYRTVPDRVARVAGLAARLAGLRAVPPPDRRVAVVLSAYPTKRSRLGNAVGLDTPASVVDVLHALRGAGYRVDRIPADGDALMAELADTLAYDRAALAEDQAARAVGRWPAEDYRRWFATLPAGARQAVVDAWGEPPGNVYVASGATGQALLFSGIDLGGVLVAVQPPRGFGENPIAVYHSPDLAPTHQYLAFYRWLEEGWGADAVVHAGKHGTLEWLPGKGVGLSASCFPDAALGSLPLVYPFVVNDPGEGTQAKRRAHAVVVDHLVPPMTRADTYDELARLEGLLDQHAQLAALDPAKLPAIRRQVWELLVEAQIHRDLGRDVERPAFEDPAFDELLLEVDGYLCELKDAQIRGGLHVLGRPPEGPAELDMVAAITRLPQGGLPSLRDVVAGGLGLATGGPGARVDVDRLAAACTSLLARCQAAAWTVPAGPLLAGAASPVLDAGGAGVTGGAGAGATDPADPATTDPADPPELSRVLGWVCQRLVPALRATTGEIDAVRRALDGRFVPPGPSGAPTRGMAHVLPTGRNFYAVDPKAVPSALAWEVGKGLAEGLVARHVAEEGRPPAQVGLVAWGTSAMRTGGDDVAEALALLGVRPVWAPETGRVTGVALVPLEELGRPRVDVTLRVSGFFRDAFPHVLDLLDQAVRLAASATDEPARQNPVAAAGLDDPRVFGPKPGAYGSGILTVLESGAWRSDEDLAAVYLAWGGWAYGAGGTGRPAGDALRRRLAGVEVAVKNQDNREHDIFDSDDYLQDHGGMVAAVRSLSGRQPKAWFGDSADPARPRVRSLAEEAARVVRSRVVNPKWLSAMQRHGYKGAFEMAATVDYLFGYDATAGVVEDWMYERVTEAYVGDPAMRKFFEQSNPWALRSIAERLLEAASRGLWDASAAALDTLRAAVLESEGWEEDR